MSVKCRECKIGTLKTIDADDATITVECQHPDCGEIYELEPDGLGQGGLEWVNAMSAKEKAEHDAHMEELMFPEGRDDGFTGLQKD